MRNRLHAFTASHPGPASATLVNEIGELIDQRRREVERDWRRALRRKPRAFVARVL